MYSSSFPGFARVFSFGSKGSSREFIADIDLDGVDPLAATRGTESVRQARARWAMGGTSPGPVVWTRLVGPVLLHASMLNSLAASSIAGWSSYPVELRGKTGEILGAYSGFVVTGRCGPLQPDRSVRAAKEYPAGTFPVLRGLFFDEASWDGTDIFMPDDDSAWVFVTERAKKVLLSGAKNLRFEKLADVEQMPMAP